MIQKLLIITLLGFINLASSPEENTSSAKETLILFSDFESTINAEDIAKIESLASTMQLEFIVKDAKNGLPKEVRSLPSLYFQNKKGRSKYYGRYTNISRLKNFIRISKMAHQKEESNIKEMVLVWKEGRTDVTAPLKITDLTGAIPSDFDQKEFKAMAKKAVAASMEKFQLLETHNNTKNTRSFYLNLYPYLSNSDELFLTAEIFSQYNCVKPIFSQLKSTVAQAKWSNKEAAFAQAAQLMEAEILRQISTSELGDAFVVVPTSVAVTDWDSLGLALPIAEEKEIKIYDTDFKIPKNWTVEPRTNEDEPILIFSFLSPVDNYAGEVKALSGSMTLGDDLSMQGAQGKFVVNIKDVTMGATDFDYEVQNKMLKMGLFPDAHFEFLELKTPVLPLQMGEEQKMEVVGKFTMLGISTTLDVETSIEPYMDENDSPKLGVNCTFQLPLFDTFQVDGPDGPSPARDILQFYMQFNLVSK